MGEGLERAERGDGTGDAVGHVGSDNCGEFRRRAESEPGNNLFAFETGGGSALTSVVGLGLLGLFFPNVFLGNFISAAGVKGLGEVDVDVRGLGVVWTVWEVDVDAGVSDCIAGCAIIRLFRN